MDSQQDWWMLSCSKCLQSMQSPEIHRKETILPFSLTYFASWTAWKLKRWGYSSSPFHSDVQHCATWHWAKDLNEILNSCHKKLRGFQDYLKVKWNVTNNFNSPCKQYICIGLRTARAEGAVKQKPADKGGLVVSVLCTFLCREFRPTNRYLETGTNSLSW